MNLMFYDFNSSAKDYEQEQPTSCYSPVENTRNTAKPRDYQMNTQGISIRSCSIPPNGFHNREKMIKTSHGTRPKILKPERLITNKKHLFKKMSSQGSREVVKSDKTPQHMPQKSIKALLANHVPNKATPSRVYVKSSQGKLF